MADDEEFVCVLLFFNGVICVCFGGVLRFVLFVMIFFIVSKKQTDQAAPCEIEKCVKPPKIEL